MPIGVYPRRSLRERLFEKILVSETGCLLWLGAKGGGGYGVVKVNGKQTAAHRVVYELVRGPIPEGLTLDHLCRVRHCVSPRHLEAVSLRVNTLRGTSLVARNASASVCKNGHPFDLVNTYYSKTGRRTCRRCMVASQLAYRKRREAKGDKRTGSGWRKPT